MFGRDQYTFEPETLILRNLYLHRNEGPLSHGYPYTSWLQLSIVYACGVYTAQQQGILKKSQFFGKFWRHHYFDWIQFGKRSLVFGWAGGLIAGTILFGNANLALKRVYGKYEYYLMDKMDDPRANENNYNIKFNN